MLTPFFKIKSMFKHKINPPPKKPTKERSGLETCERRWKSLDLTVTGETVFNAFIKVIVTQPTMGSETCNERFCARECVNVDAR